MLFGDEIFWGDFNFLGIFQGVRNFYKKFKVLK
jgi:hypothetical protein